MGETIAFLPNIQESIMDELRTTEGMIFRDEGAKKLFIDIKTFVLEALGFSHKTFDAETYKVILDSYVTWDKHVAAKELSRASLPVFADMSERLTPVTVLYAKYLYARSSPDSNISIRKPKLESLLKGMFTRMARIHHVRNGTFFDLDPLRQDFVVRDVFRQTLGNDCIEIANFAMPEVVKTVKDEDEVYPDDSISMVIEKLLHENPEKQHEKIEEKVPEVQEAVKPNTVVSTSSKHSKHTHVSQFKEPKILRKVVLENE